MRYRSDVAGTEREVHGAADQRTHTITLRLPDREPDTIDVITARAVCMLLHEAIYTSLDPTGPFLHLERHTAQGWMTRGEAR